MSLLIAAIVLGAVLVVAVLVVAVVLMQRRRTPPAPAAPLPPPVDVAPPMTGLESALDRATDRTGRSLTDRLGDEQVDDLRVPDDTGPLLRRALDHVDHPRDPAPDDGGETVDGGAAGDTASDALDPPAT